MNPYRTWPCQSALFITGVALAVLALGPAGAQAPAAARAASAASAAPAAAAKEAKDVSVDAPTGAAVSTTSAATAAPANPRLVPTPRPAPAAAASAASAAIYTTPMHDAATAATLGDLSLGLMRLASRTSGRAESNSISSPLSVAAVLGMVHAGAAGETARELAALLATGVAGDGFYAARLPSVLARMPKGDVSPLMVANRLWVRRDVAMAIPAPYLATARARFGADAAAMPGAATDSNANRQAINQWTAAQTRNRIPQLLPEGSLLPSTKLVLTNAVHFRSRWAQPFDPQLTEMRPFRTASGLKPVPTMSDDRPLLQGMVDNLQVLELPFANKAFSLMVAMPPAGHSLDALEKDLTGLDMAAWSSQLKESSCRLFLPKFTIEGAATPLKPALQALGLRRVFTDQAELQPLLGSAAAGAQVDEVFHAASVTIDEHGGEAAAATAATISAKSFQLQPPSCAVDRPFVFAIVHKATGAPVFVGKVADPAAQASR